MIGLKFTSEYIVNGTEQGETGTSHIQGYVKFKHPISFSRAKQYVGTRAHIEMQKGNDCQASEYCKKDGEWWEHGKVPVARKSQSEMSKERWNEVLKMAEEGRMEELRDKHPYVYLVHGPKLMSLRLRKAQILQGELEHEWWVGKSGTGKSKEFHERYKSGDYYFKSMNKWWDGYRDEDIVLMEEMSPLHECLATHMKLWCDRYPFTGEIKGGVMQGIRPKKIIVISNYEIDEVFTKTQDSEPMKRRFKVKRFYDFFNTVRDIVESL